MIYKTYEVRVHANGDKEWYLDGKLSREDGPAIECANGTKCWYLDGKLNREDGPAFEYANGDKEWWINGIKMSEQEFNLKTKSCAGKIVEIDGKKYRLIEV